MDSQGNKRQQPRHRFGYKHNRYNPANKRRGEPNGEEQPKYPETSPGDSGEPVAGPEKDPQELQREISEDGLCPICHEIEDIHAVAQCDHHICYKCSTRLRLLHQQFDCPLCRMDSKKVLFVKSAIKSFYDIDTSNFYFERKAKVLFESQDVEDAYKELLYNNCPICPLKEGRPFRCRTFKQLQDHVRREHQHFYCEICLEHVKLFPFERKRYTRADLATHKRKGDADDKSFKGHPLCELCDHRYLDMDELWMHLRKDHYFCHFCDTDGRHIFFVEYYELADHYREQHHLCEEDECSEVQFTNAFRSQIDLQAHKTQCHLNKFSKRRDQRQIRTLDIDINYGDRENRRTGDGLNRRAPRDHRRRDNERSDRAGVSAEDYLEVSGDKFRGNSAATNRDDSELAQAVSVALQSAPPTSAPDISVDTQSHDDFPSLGGVSRPAQPTADAKSSKKTSNKSSNKSSTRVLQGIVMHDDDEEFPSLGGERPQTAPTQSSQSYQQTTKQPERVVRKKEPSRPAQSAAVKAKSNPWSSTDEEFPALASTSTSRPHGWQIPKPQPKTNKMKFINNARPKLQSSDFPSLGGKSDSNLASIGKWVKESDGPSKKTPAPCPDLSEPDPEFERELNKPKKKKRKNKPKDEDNERSESAAVIAISEPVKLVSKTKSPIPKSESPKPTPTPEKIKSSPLLYWDDEPKQVIPVSNQFDSLSLTNTEASPPEHTQPRRSDFKWDDEDYPSLTLRPVAPKVAEPKKKKPTTPPGFGESLKKPLVRPPPGLANGHHSGVKPPPGFGQPATKSASSLSDIAATFKPQPLAPEFTVKSYIEPTNAQARNRKMIFFIKELVDNDTFHKFKNLLLDYRASVIEADQFYKRCENVLGLNNFLQIMSEMIALLPDIDKQQMLYLVCKSALDNSYTLQKDLQWGSKATDTLDICSTCGQVVLSREMADHTSEHSVATTDFPSLRAGRR